MPTHPEPPYFYDCKELDGAIIVHCLSTNGVTTFDDYAENIFIPYLQLQPDKVTRLDIVWDT